MLNIFKAFLKKKKKSGWFFFFLRILTAMEFMYLCMNLILALVSKFHFCFVIKNADRKSEEFAQKNCSNWFFFPQLSYKYLNVP